MTPCGKTIGTGEYIYINVVVDNVDKLENAESYKWKKIDEKWAVGRTTDQPT